MIQMLLSDLIAHIKVSSVKVKRGNMTASGQEAAGNPKEKKLGGNKIK